MGGEAVIKNRTLEVLEFAAAMHGPKAKEPPYVRSPFPMVTLPAVLGEFVKESAEAIGVAPECIALPALATCAAAIGNTCRVRLTPSWTEPCVIWAVTLMESGALKTPAYNLAMEPLHAAQRLAEEQFAQQQEEYHKAKAQFEAEASLWKSQATDGYRGESTPSEPVAPTPVDYFTSDSTVEALAMLFANNPRGLALTRDELSGFFGSFGAYKGGRGADEANYLEFYNAGSVKLNRASGKRIYVPAAALSIFGTCQPAVFRNAIGIGKPSNQIENGLAARFLIAAPERQPKRLLKDKPKEYRPYHELIAKLVTIPLTKDEDGRVKPAIVRLVPLAEHYFERFVEEHDQQTQSISNLALRFHYAKLEAMAARLALIFYLCDAATDQLHAPLGVQEQHVLAGIALVRWFGREAMRIYDGCDSESQQDQRELLDLIYAHGGSITPAEMHDAKRDWRNALAAKEALDNLARAGYGVVAMQRPSPNGGRSYLRFQLHDHLLSDYPPASPQNRG